MPASEFALLKPVLKPEEASKLDEPLRPVLKSAPDDPVVRVDEPERKQKLLFYQFFSIADNKPKVLEGAL